MRTRWTFPIAAALLFACAGTAQAHTGSAVVSCDTTTFNLVNFAQGPNVAHYQIIEHGDVLLAGDTPPFGRSSVVTVPLKLTGPRTIVTRLYWNQGDTSDGHAGSNTKTFTLNCPPAPLPPIVPPPPPVVVPPRTNTPFEPAPPRASCARLRAIGAGRKWLVRYGCITRTPRLTCPALRRAGASPTSLAQRGCVVPPRRVTPPVTG